MERITVWLLCFRSNLASRTVDQSWLGVLFFLNRIIEIFCYEIHSVDNPESFEHFPLVGM